MQVGILLSSSYSVSDFRALMAFLDSQGAIPVPVSDVDVGIVGEGKQEQNRCQNLLSAYSTQFDALILIGGEESVKRLGKLPATSEMVYETFKHCKTIVALGEAITLVDAHKFANIKLASTNEIITTQGVVTAGISALSKAHETGDYTALQKALFEAMLKRRHWERFPGVITISHTRSVKTV